MTNKTQTELSIKERFAQRLDAENGVGEYRGFPLKLRRMRAKALFEQGLMPMFFADVYRQAQGVEPEDSANANPDRKLTATEFDELEKFKAILIMDCCLEPKIKQAAEDAGDVLLSNLPDDVREFIYLYSQRLAEFPSSLSAQDEEVSAVTLKPFLSNRKRRPQSAAPDSRGAALQQKTKRNAGGGNGRKLASAPRARL